LVIVVAIETLIEAVILRAAIALHNWQAGGASAGSSGPELSLGKAMWITFARIGAQFIVAALIVGLFTDPGATGAAARWERGGVGAQLISFAVSLLIMADILSARLPTTLGRAINVTLCFLLVVLLVVGVLVGIAVLVFGVALRGA